MSTDALSEPGTHPWGQFLWARARCLRWLRDDQKQSISQIIEAMQMDPVQVRMILKHIDANPGMYEAVPPISTDQTKEHG